MTETSKRRFSTRRLLAVIAVLLSLASAGPCLYGITQVSPVVHYAIETGGNAALQIVLPVILGGIINGIAVLLVASTVFLHDGPL
jgi:hypothetical protein